MQITKPVQRLWLSDDVHKSMASWASGEHELAYCIATAMAMATVMGVAVAMVIAMAMAVTIAMAVPVAMAVAMAIVSSRTMTMSMVLAVAMVMAVAIAIAMATAGGRGWVPLSWQWPVAMAMAMVEASYSRSAGGASRGCPAYYLTPAAFRVSLACCESDGKTDVVFETLIYAQQSGVVQCIEEVSMHDLVHVSEFGRSWKIQK